jgi:hypothetical protein
MNAEKKYCILPILIPTEIDYDKESVVFEHLQGSYASNYTTQYTVAKLDRYPKQVLEILELFSAILKDALDNYIKNIRNTSGDLYRDVLQKDLAPKLASSKNAVQCWMNAKDITGKKLGVGDLVLLMFLMNDFSAIKSLNYYCEKLEGLNVISN